MTNIVTSIRIKATVQSVFDLAREITIHEKSAKQTVVNAISGKTSGLLELGEIVTWEARHFFIKQQFTSKITEFEEPNYFTNEMQKGVFKTFKHTHQFTFKKQ